MNKLNIGIIGIGGRIGKMHHESLMRNPGKVNITAVCDIEKHHAYFFAGLTGADSYTGHKKFLGRSDIDTVFILTPSNTHYELAIDCAEAKKNIFCEKPITDTLKKAEEIVEAINKNKVKYQLGYQRRSDPAYAEAKKLVEEDKIGKLLLFKSTSKDPFPVTFMGM